MKCIASKINPEKSNSHRQPQWSIRLHNHCESFWNLWQFKLKVTLGRVLFPLCIWTVSDYWKKRCKYHSATIGSVSNKVKGRVTRFSTDAQKSFTMVSFRDNYSDIKYEYKIFATLLKSECSTNDLNSMLTPSPLEMTKLFTC